MFLDRLKDELSACAPDWEWFCESAQVKSPDKISPKMLSVSAQNKHTGVKTSAIQLSNTPTANLHQAAQFICDVLMINPPEPVMPGAAMFER